MWLVRNEDKGLIYRVHPGKQNVVSRKDGDLLLLGDQSISRKHAELSVHNENQNGGIVLKDLGSKYGTFAVLGGGELSQVSPNQPITLKDGDRIRFGIQWNIWRVEYFPLVVATSTLNGGEKTEVKEVVAALGGEVVSDWQSCCTHLTMNKLTVTVKVVCALACGKPIVIPGYWKALREALVSTETKLPDCKDFVPPLAEALLNPSAVSFTPNTERCKLFSGYTFVAASARQLTRIKPMITAAGGNAVEFSASLWPDTKLTRDKTILMQHTAADKQGSQHSQVPDGYIAAARKLKAAGVRCVPESEIGLSILYCSTAQYCNPKFSHHSLFGTNTSQSTQQITVICPTTEESIKPQLKGDNSKSTSSKKRTLEDSSEEEQHPSKKPNSEDMFDSSGIGNRTTRSSVALKESGPKAKQQAVNPSLDMFAPSGQISGQSDLNKNKITLNKEKSSTTENNPKKKTHIINQSLDMFAPSGQISGHSDLNKNTLNKEKSNTIENDLKKQPLIVNPSLDMFAPSGQISNKENKSEMGPSCQDMFATNERRRSQENKRTNCNDSRLVSNKKARVVLDDEEDDDFSFMKNNKSSKPLEVAEKDDEFSFSSVRRSNRQHPVDKDNGDEFSFASNKKGSHQNMVEDQNDDFSFVSSKRANKRDRQGNPDVFVPTAECSRSNNRVSRSNVKTNFNITSNDSDDGNDDVFCFAGGPDPKRRKNNESSSYVDEPEEEVKLALFSKKGSPSSVPLNSNEAAVVDEPPENKNLVTYSKEKPSLLKVKEEDEEVDELAKELYNATIVVVKPLVVERPKPTEAQSARVSSGKNFKKFRKVTGVNKRIVPHIIGGSDLVPHYANCQNIDDVLPSSPRPMSPDDDWGFANEKKKKGKNR